MDDTTMAKDPARRRRRTPMMRRLVRGVLGRGLDGRRVDPDDASRGRFCARDLDEVAGSTLRHMDQLFLRADLGQLSSLGNRLNVRLAVLTIALYRALLDFGVERDHAADLVADVGWRVYRAGARPVIAVAALRHREPARRMATALRMFLRFPFAAPGRPGYEVHVEAEPDAFSTTWTWCPPLAFVNQVIDAEGDRGELHAFRRSWCSYDWALNDLLTGGRGDYRRPHTMSSGDDRCDMVWAVAPARPTRTDVRISTTTGRRPAQSDGTPGRSSIPRL